MRVIAVVIDGDAVTSRNCWIGFPGGDLQGIVPNVAAIAGYGDVDVPTNTPV